jgi:hypothetical protein
VSAAGRRPPVSSRRGNRLDESALPLKLSLAHRAQRHGMMLLRPHNSPDRTDSQAGLPVLLARHPPWRGGQRLACGLGFDVVLGSALKDLRRWGDLRRGRLQDRIPPRRLQVGRCRVGAIPGRILAVGQLPVLVRRGIDGLLLSVEVAAPVLSRLL